MRVVFNAQSANSRKTSTQPVKETKLRCTISAHTVVPISTIFLLVTT